MDFWGPIELEKLPPEGLHQFADLVRAIEAYAALPLQALFNLIVLKAKPLPGGGERPIGLLAMVYRVWARCRKHLVSNWALAAAGPWGTAIAKSSAIRAAYQRSALDESALDLGLNSASILWDAEKFYDSLDLARLIESAQSLGYPALPLALAMQLHMGPRFIKGSTCFALGVDPANGIVAGDNQANDLARSAMYYVVERVATGRPSMGLYTFC